MADGSRIEWTDSTWNIVTGCSVVSAGCKRCYAMKLAGTRLKHDPSRKGLTIDTSAGPVWNGQVRFNTQWLAQPLRWKRSRKIFVCAHGDLFHESVPDEWIDQVFAIMALAPQHTFQVLTKRAERMHRYFEARRPEGWTEGYIRLLFDRPARAFPSEFARLPLNNNAHMPWPLPNVWLGVSVENQAAADERIPFLLQTHAAVRWLSCEPLLGPINFRWTPYAWQAAGKTYREYLNAKGTIDQYESLRKIDWIVAGGESGPGSRPMHPEWDRMLRDQCSEANVPFYLKQWGEWVPGDQAACSLDDCYASSVGGWVEMDGAWSSGENAKPARPQAAHVFRVGKKRAGRLLDGVLHDAYPIRTGTYP